MRAAVFAGPGILRLEDTPLPQPGPGELRLRLSGCGVCASNLPVWEGRPWFDYPLEPGAPGHEGWGVVDAVGAGVTEIEAGDRVAALSYRAYAECDIAPADAVVRLPASLADQPFPGEPLGCAMNVFARSGVGAGQTVAVVGIGFLGALLVQLAVGAGARVIAITRRPFALELARQLGAAETVVMDDHWRIIERVKALTGGEGCERVIEAVGAQWPLDLAAELCRVRGRLVIAGYHQDGPRQVNMQLWNWRGLDVVSAHEREPEVYLRGMLEAVEAVRTGRLDPAPLYTHTLPLDRLDQALELSRERPEGFFKALVSL
ncbi:MAG: zinc-binding dehydrogenase [Deinococcota bacterium]|jgi:threonine dehydrogenase-like Zn-dependent dehydrogenase|nr:zinc-binding dehydrogenase [Deinococcota bacterium]